MSESFSVDNKCTLCHVIRVMAHLHKVIMNAQRLELGQQLVGSLTGRVAFGEIVAALESIPGKAVARSIGKVNDESRVGVPLELEALLQSTSNILSMGPLSSADKGHQMILTSGRSAPPAGCRGATILCKSCKFSVKG